MTNGNIFPKNGNFLILIFTRCQTNTIIKMFMQTYDSVIKDYLLYLSIYVLQDCPKCYVLSYQSLILRFELYMLLL